MKSAFLATKSVSQLISSRALPEWATRPLAVVRPARLVTSLAPLIRRISTALSKSPSASSSAFLQSIMPAAVRSRSFLTSAAVKFDMLLSLRLWLLCHFAPAETGSSSLGACGDRLVALAATLEQVTLPLGERFVGADDARFGLLIGAGRL